jgi:hypothetical protein
LNHPYSVAIQLPGVSYSFVVARVSPKVYFPPKAFRIVSLDIMEAESRGFKSYCGIGL